MGFRISLYKCPKDVVSQYKDMTDADFENADVDYPETVKDVEQMMYDVSMWMYFDEYIEMVKQGKTDKIMSRLFNNKMSLECDMSYDTMNKEQCLNFINMIRRFILQNNKHLDDEGFNDIKKLIKNEISVSDMNKRYTSRHNKHLKLNALEFALELSETATFDGTFAFNCNYSDVDDSFNEHMNDNYAVDFNWGWKACLTNLIYIYKTFDWDNNVILVCGG